MKFSIKVLGTILRREMSFYKITIEWKYYLACLVSTLCLLATEQKTNISNKRLQTKKQRIHIAPDLSTTLFFFLLVQVKLVMDNNFTGISYKILTKPLDFYLPLSSSLSFSIVCNLIHFHSLCLLSSLYSLPSHTLSIFPFSFPISLLTCKAKQ